MRGAPTFAHPLSGHDGTGGPLGPPGPDPGRPYRTLGARLGLLGLAIIATGGLEMVRQGPVAPSLLVGTWLLAIGARLHHTGVARTESYRRERYRLIGQRSRRQVVLRLVENVTGPTARAATDPAARPVPI